ncbi:hypothetical protein Tco_0653718, partial [Tanacetum coccineum]
SEPVPMATVVNAPIVSMSTYVSTTIAQDAPSTREPSSIQSTSGDIATRFSLEGKIVVLQKTVPNNRSSKEAKEPNLQISVDTTASADVPSSVSKTTDTTSTLQPPPPPL